MVCEANLTIELRTPGCLNERKLILDKNSRYLGTILVTQRRYVFVFFRAFVWETQAGINKDCSGYSVLSCQSLTNQRIGFLTSNHQQYMILWVC